MNEKLVLIGKVESVNVGEHFCNTTIVNEHKKSINIKLEKSEIGNILLGKAYVFDVYMENRNEKDVYVYIESNLIEDKLEDSELDRLLPIFYNYAPISPEELRTGIESYLNLITNVNIKNITLELYNQFKIKFYTHPAATKFHHAYVGGLAYHTLTMLKLASGVSDVYPYLNKDLIYSGIILHDMAKIEEITGADGEYTKEGLLLGHLVMMTIEVEKVALKLGLEKSEEALLLKHIIISHHGILNYGSPKRPQTGEALLIWFLDTIDSKFAPLGDAYNETENGQFTNMLQVLDRMRFYKDEFK